MHPQIRRLGPGICPICGMALEPVLDNPEAEDRSELDAMTQRFWVSAALTTPLVVLTMSDLIPMPIPSRVMSSQHLALIAFALATPVVLWGGWPFFVRAWASIVNRSLNMFTLIGLGVAVAFGYSVVAVLVPDRFPSSLRGMDGQVPVYFEAASVIVALVLLGQVLELRAR